MVCSLFVLNLVNDWDKFLFYFICALLFAEKEAPDQFAYKVKLKKERDPRICGACACGISRKAWLPTETCPVADPSRLVFNLWGESIKNSPATSL
jgi:hypothetical protein